MCTDPCSKMLIECMTGSNAQPGLSDHDWCEQKKRICGLRGGKGTKCFSADVGLPELDV